MKDKILLHINATICTFSLMALCVVIFKARIGEISSGFAWAFSILALVTATYTGIAACYHEHFAEKGK